MVTENRKKVSRGKVIFIYLMCAVGAAVAPVEQFVSHGRVHGSTVVIAIVSFLVGMAVASIVIHRFNKTGRFMQFRQ